MIVDERQTVHVGNDEVARVLAANPSRVIERGLHESLRRVLVGYTTLAAVAFPLAPRGRSSRIIHAEKQIIVALDEDRAGQIRDGFLEWSFADVTRQLKHNALAQVTAQCGAVRIPKPERPTACAPITATTIDQRAENGLQVGTQGIVKRVFPRPCSAARVLRGIEAERQAGGHAITRLIFVEQRLENHARIRRVEGSFALVVAVREQMAGIIVLRL